MMTELLCACATRSALSNAHLHALADFRGRGEKKYSVATIVL